MFVGDFAVDDEDDCVDVAAAESFADWLWWNPWKLGARDAEHVEKLWATKLDVSGWWQTGLQEILFSD